MAAMFHCTRSACGVTASARSQSVAIVDHEATVERERADQRREGERQEPERARASRLEWGGQKGSFGVSRVVESRLRVSCTSRWALSPCALTARLGSGRGVHVLSSLLGSRFWLTCYAAILVGFFTPLPDWLASGAVAPSLGGILFFTTLGVGTDAFLVALSGPARARLLPLTFWKLLGIPILVCVVTALVAPTWTLGMTLMAAMPAGLSSPTLSAVHRTTAVPSGLALVAVTSLACPVTVPLLMAGVGLLPVELPHGTGLSPLRMAVDQGVYIAFMLALPWLSTRLVRRGFPAWVDRNRSHFRTFALLSLVVLVFTAAAACRPVLVSVGPSLGFEGLALVTGATVLMGAVALLLAERLPGDEAVSFPCGVVFMNNGLAVTIAAKSFPDDVPALLAAVLIEVPILVGVSWVGTVAARRARRREL